MLTRDAVANFTVKSNASLRPCAPGQQSFEAHKKCAGRSYFEGPQ